MARTNVRAWKSVVALSIVVCLVLSACGGTQPQNASIAGTIRLATGGAGRPGTQGRPVPTQQTAAVYTTVKGGSPVGDPVARTESGPDGRFTVSVAPGTYYVVAEYDGATATAAQRVVVEADGHAKVDLLIAFP